MIKYIYIGLMTILLFYYSCIVLVLISSLMIYLVSLTSLFFMEATLYLIGIYLLYNSIKEFRRSLWKIK